VVKKIDAAETPGIAQYKCGHSLPLGGMVREMS